MNAHSPIDRTDLILGALGLTDSNPDPIREQRERARREAQNLVTNIDILMEALPHYRKTVANRAVTGTYTTADDEARLAVLVAFNDVEYSSEIEDIIDDLSRDLGIDPDATDDSFAEQVRADYYERKL